MSFLSFYSKYKSAAESLEEQVDDSFNELYSALEDDLESNQLTAGEAQEFKEKYESSKKDLRKELMSKALSYF
ncbi:hypothetical protein QTG56_22555 (plasmid) [Rossellomorea sp. AcN35-11]|nr:hypothetical protein QTG56_22555 [Rossellomorea sp. AcN35-11]